MFSCRKTLIKAFIRQKGYIVLCLLKGSLKNFKQDKNLNLTGPILFLAVQMIYHDLWPFEFKLSLNELSPDNVGVGVVVVEGRGVVVVEMSLL